MEASLLIRLVDQFSGPGQKVKDTLKGIGDAARGLKQGFKDGFSQAIKQGFSIDNLEAATKNAEARLNKARQNLLGAVASATAIVAPAKFAAEFSAQMSNVATLIDTNVESMAKMKDQVLEIADRTPVALSDLTGALYDIRSAGIKAGDAMNVLEGSARLAVAGLGDTKEAVDLVTSSINAFNLQGQDQAKIYDIIFKAVKNGKTTISGLSQGFGAVAGTVAAAHVKIDEYMASVAALTTTGMPAAQAHTQIRTAIAGLTRETKETDAVFKKLHAKNFKDLVDKSGGMVNAFAKIRAALKNDDAALLKLLGSTEALNAVLGLTGAQSQVFTDTLEDMRNGANAVDEAFGKQAEEAAARFQILRNTLRHVAITIGNELLPVMIDLMKAAGPIIHDVLEWAKAHPDLTKAIVGSVAGLLALNVATRLLSFGLASVRLPLIGLASTFLKFDETGRNVAIGWRLLAGSGRMLGMVGTGLLGPALSMIGSLLIGTGAALGAVTAPMWALAGAFVAGAFAVWKYWDRFSSFMKGFLAPFGNLAKAAGDLLGQAVDAMLSKLSEMTGFDFGGAKAAIASFFDFSGIVDGARAAVADFWTWLKGLLSPERLSSEQKAGFEAAGEQLGQAIVDGIKQAAEALWEWFSSWPAIIKEKIGSIDLSGIFKKPEWLDTLLGYLGGDGGSPTAEKPAIGPPLQGANAAPGGKDAGWFSSLFGGLSSDASNAGDNLVNGGQKGGDAVAKGGQDAANALKQAAGEIRAAASGLRNMASAGGRPVPAPSPRSGAALYDGGND